ncbi:MAG: hypothetical protein ACKVUS_06275 [Saprospiraceae bacterium]
METLQGIVIVNTKDEALRPFSSFCCFHKFIHPAVFGFRVKPEKRAASFFLIVDGARVGTQHNVDLVTEPLAGMGWLFWISGKIKPFASTFFGTNQPMKMVGHQAISQEVSVRQNKLTHFSQEEQVVFIAKKDLLAIVALVVNVVNDAGLEVHVGWF